MRKTRSVFVAWVIWDDDGMAERWHDVLSREED